MILTIDTSALCSMDCAGCYLKSYRGTILSWEKLKIIMEDNFKLYYDEQQHTICSFSKDTIVPFPDKNIELMQEYANYIGRLPNKSEQTFGILAPIEYLLILSNKLYLFENVQVSYYGGDIKLFIRDMEMLRWSINPNFIIPTITVNYMLDECADIEVIKDEINAISNVVQVVHLLAKKPARKEHIMKMIAEISPDHDKVQIDSCISKAFGLGECLQEQGIVPYHPDGERKFCQYGNKCIAWRKK